MSSWYVLKNRRHVGPYKINDLEALHKKGLIKAEDYLIARVDAERGDLQYKHVSDVAPHLRAPAAQATPSLDIQSQEAPLATFSDEDLLKSKVSRVFSEAFDSVDLTNASRMVQVEGQRSAEAAPAKSPLPALPTIAQISDENTADLEIPYKYSPRKNLWIWAGVGSLAMALVVALIVANNQMPSLKTSAANKERKVSSSTTKSKSTSQPAAKIFSKSKLKVPAAPLNVPKVAEPDFEPARNEPHIPSEYQSAEEIAADEALQERAETNKRSKIKRQDSRNFPGEAELSAIVHDDNPEPGENLPEPEDETQVDESVDTSNEE